MPQLPAALLILIDKPHPDKQELLCLAAAAAEQLRVVALCRHWRDAVALHLDLRHIVAVVCALDPGEEARAEFARLGVMLVVARRQQQRIRRSVADLVARLWRRGMAPAEIAEVLDVPPGDVRRSLDRLKPRTDPRG